MDSRRRGKCAVLFLAALLVFMTTGSSADSLQRMEDSGFEQLPAGKLETMRPGAGWEVQRVGRRVIQKDLIAECLTDEGLAKSGRNVVRMGIPEATSGFEFVAVGQRVQLRGDREYEASVWVRWAEGPEKAPEGASATSGHPSAIVSFWARHKEATGDFAGRDVWLFDRQWSELTVRFRATDPDQRTFVYVSLLPNQTPRETSVLIDDFHLRERESPVRVAKNQAELVVDGGFSDLPAGKFEKGGWSFANIGGEKLIGEVVEEDQEKWFRMTMDGNTSNHESGQLWQMLQLEEGVAYEIRCRMRWDNFIQEGATNPIVNFGLFHEETKTWYGPIDQYLKASKEWGCYRFVHMPPRGGAWKLYVQLNGWGNFGNALTVSFDDFSCRSKSGSRR